MAVESSNRWSADVARKSDALTLEPGVFTLRSARGIAQSLKASAERSRRRKGTPFQSAMSMLNFFMNRMGTQLSPTRKNILEKAKDELRRLFGRPPAKAATKPVAARKSAAKSSAKSPAKPASRKGAARKSAPPVRRHAPAGA